MSHSIIEFTPAHREAVDAILHDVTLSWGKQWYENICHMYCLECTSKGFLLKYVALDGQDVVGTILLRRAIDMYVIEFLAVKKGLRGVGVGSELVHFAEKLAREKGAKGLRVDVASDLRQNLSFYRKLGFEICGHVQDFYEPGDSQVFLTKNLAAAQVEKAEK
ncbi:Acetyltransferase (GNAT) family protein [Candidatus Burarchaeum australiense]|nr:Acetyltransferase (GNAT) family protein [Candidatus Burarchaeum australiense]